MSRKAKVILSSILIFSVVLAAGILLYVKKMAPPGEEWILYGREEVIGTIDGQLKGMDIERIVAEKETYVAGKSIQEIQSYVQEGKLNYEELTAICLQRIKTLDQKEKGYNSVICVNAHAMEEAREKDAQYPDGQEDISGIYGIPVMLKDNINTADMPTSAGAEAFSDFYPEKDAELVEKLKADGAIILGKNNLSEFANYLSGVMPAGYSGRKGQTVNPFSPLKISASGSSSGSAVSVTADLVPVSIGTETDGSIVAPASANSVVGFKPTRGNISSEGIFPLLRKVDTAGPVAKSVKDAAIAYQAASGIRISTEFQKDALTGKRIGVAGYEYNDGEMLSRMKTKLEELGADVIDVDLTSEDVIIFNNIRLSFKQEFEEYAKTYGLPIKTLDELLKYNQEEPERRIKYGQDYLEDAQAAQDTDSDEMELSIQSAEQILGDLFQSKSLDGIVFLNSSGSTIPAAAGYPELAVPFGKDKKGVPQGVTFVAQPGEEEKLLNLGYSFEAHVKGRMSL